MQYSEQKHIHQLIFKCQLDKQDRFRKRLNTLTNKTATTGHEKKLKKLLNEIETSQQWVKDREKSLPSIPFNQSLPSNEKRDKIAKLIQENQVIILAGETGSGKTTQLPKICLSLGLGSKGLIGHTQPRRIAARTVATRIAEELNTSLGDIIGYQVRFTEESSNNTRVKLMTDGVLLAELQRDRFLTRYDAIIIDEAHERSLNIDFLLGLLKRILNKRPELKLIITSATIDLEKFSKHFDNAPIMEVSGRTYPVEVIYQPDIIHDKNQKNIDLSEIICQTVKQIIDSEGRGEFTANGDILVFCAGERNIRETAKALNDHKLSVNVLPLYARLSNKEQVRVFKPSQQRKVVLATNVAETSITVPGIGYVIDPGVARISRYSFKSKVQRLPIERISQASANQRMGRCGRMANGICIRLYSKDDFLQRPAFTEAEILRSNLAAVIMQMLQIGIKDIQHFPFIDKPDNRLLNDGFKLLEELQAIHHSKDKLTLSKKGKLLCQIPTDPKYARILLEANELNCLHEVIVIVAALSSQDPREWPADKKQAAREKHQLLEYKRSDFITYLNLWETINQQRQALTNKQFRNYCNTHFLSLARIFEWRDMVSQLTQQTKQLNWTSSRSFEVSFIAAVDDNSSSSKSIDKKKLAASEQKQQQKYDSIHRALLTGLLSNIAFNDLDNEYIASRGRRLHIFPASALTKKTKKKKDQHRSLSKPAKNTRSKWIISNELIETSRLFAHVNAEINSDWVLQAGKHLLKYSYSSPSYYEQEGVVKAQRNTSLYGLDLHDKQRVLFSKIDPTLSRELFIQRALVEGAYGKHAQFRKSQIKNSQHFFNANQRIINKIEDVETKTRKRNLLISDIDLFRLYDEILPKDIDNVIAFEQWRKTDNNEKLITFGCDQLTLGNLSEELLETLTASSLFKKDDIAQFPSNIIVNGKTLPLSYHFNPEDEHDGVTLTLPIELLEPFPEYIGSWLVPGLLREKCIALIKALPKQYRKLFAPAANTVDRVLPMLTKQNQHLTVVLGEQLRKTTGHIIPNDAWQETNLDPYYLMNYRLLETKTSLNKKDSKPIQSRDLATLKKRYAKIVSDSLRVDNAPDRKQFEQSNIMAWDFGNLEQYLDYQHQGMTVRAHPMLKLEDNDQSISLSLHESSDLAIFFTRQALATLALKQFAFLKSNFNYLKKEIFKPKSRNDNLELYLLSLAPTKTALNQLSLSLIKQALSFCCFSQQSIPRTATEFQNLVIQGSKKWVEYAVSLETSLIEIAKQLTTVQRQINSVHILDINTDESLEEIKSQVFDLFEESYLKYSSLKQLKQYSRYLQVAEKRLEKIHVQAPGSFKSHLEEFEQYLVDQMKQAQKVDDTLLTTKQSLHFIYQSQPTLFEHRIMLREWHCSIFAQQLGTQFPVSEKRVLKHWQSITTIE